jgi:outer membrane receptor protein involved in Fe transport
VNYKVSDDVLLFAFYQKAFKSGGFNANSADRFAFQTPYGPEKVDSFEGGMKGEFMNHRLRVNINGFYSKFNDLQRSQVVASSTAPSGVTTVTTNNADVKSYGVETEFAARVMTDLTLFANIGWNKAYYTRYCFDFNGAEATSTPVDTPARRLRRDHDHHPGQRYAAVPGAAGLLREPAAAGAALGHHGGLHQGLPAGVRGQCPSRAR